jgi:hypothetical protein
MTLEEFLVFGPARYLVARDHRLPALRHVHLLMNVLHRDLLVSARSLSLALLVTLSPATNRPWSVQSTPGCSLVTSCVP